MNFVKINSTQPVADYLTKALNSRLESGQSVLWLVPGGSSITVAAEVARQLVGGDLSKLYVTLTDERFGSVGHTDSNWLQLEKAGFKLPGAQLLPILKDTSRRATTRQFSRTLESYLQQTDYKLGFFGIGADGHTAGILPHSPAVESTDCAASYDAGQFRRITMTPGAISQLDEAVVYAIGEAKWPVLDQMAQSLPPADQPAQALKKVSKLTIFNDYKGDAL